MKNKIDIKSIFTKLARKPGALHDKQLMHPKREWVIGLVVSGLLFLLAASMSVYVYFKNQSVNVQVPVGDTEQAVYRESLVKEALTIINSREEKLRSLNKEIVPPEVIEIESATTTQVQEEDLIEATTTTSQ